jgi:hypothetical protein
MIRERTPEELDEIYDGQREDMAVDQKVSKWMRQHGPARDWYLVSQALEEENKRLREALQFIASQEPLTFAECSVAEAIIGRAKAALGDG